MSISKVFRLALSAAISALILAAQTGGGTVQGVVKDTSSAVIAGARVTVVHTATMRQYSTTTNSVGFFSFPPAQPGSYRITAEAAGMQTWEGKFVLQVGQTVEISPVLAAGAVTTQVNIVADAAPLVTTSDATLATILERTRIEQLPMNGRNIANQVLASTPGLTNGPQGAVQPIVNGLRDSVALLQDGAG